MQWEASVDGWLEGHGQQLHLMVVIDAATSQAYARFVEQDSTEENLRVLKGYLERRGRPVEFCTDKHSMFAVNRPRREGEDEAWPEALTQIGRAL